MLALWLSQPRSRRRVDLRNAVMDEDDDDDDDNDDADDNDADDDDDVHDDDDDDVTIEDDNRSIFLSVIYLISSDPTQSNLIYSSLA